MLPFLLILTLVFVAVDLFIQLIIDPLASKRKEKHAGEISTKIIGPMISLVGATMYDGGELKQKKETKK